MFTCRRSPCSLRALPRGPGWRWKNASINSNGIYGIVPHSLCPYLTPTLSQLVGVDAAAAGHIAALLISWCHVIAAIREVAFLNSVMSAGVMYTLTLNCSMGHFKGCSCDKSRRNSDKKKGNPLFLLLTFNLSWEKRQVCNINLIWNAVGRVTLLVPQRQSVLSVHLVEWYLGMPTCTDSSVHSTDHLHHITTPLHDAMTALAALWTPMAPAALTQLMIEVVMLTRRCFNDFLLLSVQTGWNYDFTF